MNEYLMPEFESFLQRGFRISLSKRLGTYEVLAFFTAKDGERWRFLGIHSDIAGAWENVKMQVSRAVGEGKMK